MNHKRNTMDCCVKNRKGVVIMENREKIIQMLENPLISGYGIEKMSNGRLYS
ncbi:hypothetical protein D927_01670, partial [Enterococcus faecalis 02-MB-BW-10]